MSDPKILSDDEAIASLIPITDEERATCAPMSEALFIVATRFKEWATLEQHITALDRAGYWGDKSISLLEKRTHTRHKLERYPRRNGTTQPRS
jgi:hypothetical protein